MLRRIGTLYVIVIGIFACSSGFIFTKQTNDLVSEKVQGLISKKVLEPIKKLHDPASLDMFSRAFIGSVWKYDLVSKPSKGKTYYQFMLREYRGAFVIDQYKMRVFVAENKVTLEDWQKKEFLDSSKWIEFYKNQKGKK